MRWSFVSGALARAASEAQFNSSVFTVREPSRSRFPFCRSVPVLDDLVARGCVGRLLCSGCEVSAEWSDGVSVSSAWCLAGGASRRLLSGGFNPDLSGLACSAFFELRNLGDGTCGSVARWFCVGSSMSPAIPCRSCFLFDLLRSRHSVSCGSSQLVRDDASSSLVGISWVSVAA